MVTPAWIRWYLVSGGGLVGTGRAHLLTTANMTTIVADLKRNATDTWKVADGVIRAACCLRGFAGSLSPAHDPLGAGAAQIPGSLRVNRKPGPKCFSPAFLPSPISSATLTDRPTRVRRWSRTKIELPRAFSSNEGGAASA